MTHDARHGWPSRPDRTALAWGAVALFFVIGDLATTAVGLSTGVATEAGPVVGPIVDQYGLAVTVPLKATAVACCVLLWWVTPERYAQGVPIGTAAVGVLVTAWNVSILAVGL